MNPIEQLKAFLTQPKDEDFFTRNRNKRIMARTTLPTKEEIAQDKAEKGI